MSDNDAEPLGLDPDEPQTPIWLTALGVCLFLFAGIFMLATGDDEEDLEMDVGGEKPTLIEADK